MNRESEIPVGAAALAAPDNAAAKTGSWRGSRKAWFAVVMVSMVTFFGQLDRGIMALLLASIKRETGMSDTQLSLLIGLAYSLPYALIGIPVARWADVGRRTRILPAALALWSVGTAFCGLAQSFWQFFLFRCLIGAGESIKGPTSTSLIPDFVPRNRLSRAFGVYNIGLATGESMALVLGGLLLGFFAHLSPIVVPYIGSLHGWRLVYLVFGLPGIILALVFVLTVPEPKRYGKQRAGSATIGEVIAFFLKGKTARVYLPLLAAAVLNSLYLMGTAGWRPTFYERTYGLTPDQYGPISGTVTMVAALVGVSLGAFLVERLSRKWDDAHMRLVLITEIITIPVAIAGPLMPTFALALSCHVALNVLLMVSAPSRLAAMQIITPNEMRAQANAIFMLLFGAVGAGLGPTAVALITDYLFQNENELRYAMVTAAAISAPIVAIFTLSTLRPYGQLYREIVSREDSDS